MASKRTIAQFWFSECSGFDANSEHQNENDRPEEHDALFKPKKNIARNPINRPVRVGLPPTRFPSWTLFLVCDATSSRILSTKENPSCEKIRCATGKLIWSNLHKPKFPRIIFYQSCRTSSQIPNINNSINWHNPMARAFYVSVIFHISPCKLDMCPLPHLLCSACDEGICPGPPTLSLTSISLTEGSYRVQPLMTQL